MFVAGLMRDNCGMIGLSDITPRACSAAIASGATPIAMISPIIAANARPRVSRSSIVADARSSVTDADASPARGP